MLRFLEEFPYTDIRHIGLPTFGFLLSACFCPHASTGEVIVIAQTGGISALDIVFQIVWHQLYEYRPNPLVCSFLVVNYGATEAF